MTRITRIVSFVSFVILAAALTACAGHPVPEVSAEDAAACPGCDGGGVQRSPGQIILAVFELIPGANFFLIPVEYSLTGTTGLEQLWIQTCDGFGGEWTSSPASCTEGPFPRDDS